MPKIKVADKTYYYDYGMHEFSLMFSNSIFYKLCTVYNVYKYGKCI